MPISLAAIRHQRVFAKYGGPIERLEVFPQRSMDALHWHSANAFLSASLRPSWVPTLRLYANAEGSGTHSIRNVACHIAISEALERWAFYVASDGEDRSKYGFDQDPSTTGMAAFPGFLKSAARKHAALEAAERWSIVEWWLGRIPSRSIRHDTMEGAVEILSPFQRCFIIIVWRRCTFGGLAFGFAAGPSINEAIRHAHVERDRNIVALESLAPRNSSVPEWLRFPHNHSIVERRLVFFASREGEALFHERRERGDKNRSMLVLPRTLVDCQIPGPWDRYTTVWRTLYEQTSDVHLDDKRNDFFSF